MKMKLKVCKINTKCVECGSDMAGKTAALVHPNTRTKRIDWLLCARCFFSIGEKFVASEGYDIVSSALREEL